LSLCYFFCKDKGDLKPIERCVYTKWYCQLRSMDDRIEWVHMSLLLNTPLPMGDFILPNRILMAPLTRCRAGKERIPNALMADYYRQRASAGLILSEATSISPMGVGYAETPGIWSDEQTEGWKLVTSAVHAAGGRIFLQLWHVGRVSDPVFLDGRQPVAPSAIAIEGHISRVRPKRPYAVPRALSEEEIEETVKDYGRAARRAKAAGFDGVELHGANGYLIDQFLQASSNRRTDGYGGPIENRLRFLIEATEAVLQTWPSTRVGMHLYLRGGEDPADPSGAKVFTAVAEALGERQLAFLCCREPRSENWLLPRIKAAFGGVVVANQEFTLESAEATLAAGEADAVAWGRDFIANPDLPRRFLEGAPLNTPDTDTFYDGVARGYTDYPAL
jgi:2,4-dienoyl-CoA reductase-like NADH-dependent reductase (Old Yellow Enzyme family)